MPGRSGKKTAAKPSAPTGKTVGELVEGNASIHNSDNEDGKKPRPAAGRSGTKTSNKLANTSVENGEPSKPKTEVAATETVTHEHKGEEQAHALEASQDVTLRADLLPFLDLLSPYMDFQMAVAKIAIEGRGEAPKRKAIVMDVVQQLRERAGGLAKRTRDDEEEVEKLTQEKKRKSSAGDDAENEKPKVEEGKKKEVLKSNADHKDENKEVDSEVPGPDKEAQVEVESKKKRKTNAVPAPKEEVPTQAEDKKKRPKTNTRAVQQPTVTTVSQSHHCSDAVSWLT
jgi:hypothetical protein